MKIFDRIDPASLDRREWHLWILALTVIVVLALGMALFMFPAVFSNPVVLSGPTMRKSFFGFCALLILFVGYLVDRHIVVTKLRKQLANEQKKIIHIRHEASLDLLNSLPGLDHFRDRFAMEYRRASNTGQTLSLQVVNLKPSRHVTETTEVATAFGDAAKALARRLRGQDSIYRFAPGVFGIVLPGLMTKDAFLVADRLADGLHGASGASDRFAFDVHVLNYPEHAATAREIEQMARGFLPKDVQLGNTNALVGLSTGTQ